MTNEQDDPERSPDEVRKRFGESPGAQQIDSLPAANRRQLKSQEWEERLDLRKGYGYGLLVVLLLQLVFVHIVFLWYAMANGWVVSDAVFIAYLAKTLGETVGLAAIVVRYLFPPPVSYGDTSQDAG